MIKNVRGLILLQVQLHKETLNRSGELHFFHEEKSKYKNWLLGDSLYG